MSVTLDLQTLLIALVLIALIVLIIYVIVLIKRLFVTLTHLDKVLEDCEVVSGIAAERSQDLDGIISNVSGTVADLSDAVKGNQTTVSAIASIAKSAASIKGMMSDKK